MVILEWGGEEYRQQKIKEQKDAIQFFMKFTEADCDRIAIENPVGIMSNLYKAPSCIYNPYDFQGETESKREPERSPRETESRREPERWRKKIRKQAGRKRT